MTSTLHVLVLGRSLPEFRVFDLGIFHLFPFGSGTFSSFSPELVLFVL